MKISPTGEYLAATVPVEDQTMLVIMRRSDMAITGHVTLGPKSHVSDFYWANSAKILFHTTKKFGRLSAPTFTIGTYWLNVDGKQGYLSPIGGLLDTLQDDDDFVLVRYGTGSGYSGVGKMNVNTGNLKGSARLVSPIPGNDYYADNAGEVQFFYGFQTSQNTSRLYIRNYDESKWEIINEEKLSGIDITGMGFSSDNKIAYLYSQEKTGPDAIYAFDMKTRQKTLLARDDNVNPDSLLTSPVDNSLFGIRYFDGYPRIELLDKENPFAKDLLGLKASFKNADVIPVSSTKDGNLTLYLVWSDKIVGDYYLFDHASRTASFLASKAAWLNPQQLADTKPFNLIARDGLKLEGFLTIPTASVSKNLPVVVIPHGGPYEIYDTWGFDAEIQLLANRGYAVLQVNFRGSGNYGKEFIEKGYQQWGATMQDDVTDATRWAIAQGIADPGRICIYGASYGAYAAMMGAAREPNLYRCAIGNVGVYDLPKMVTDDSWASWIAKKYFAQTMDLDRLYSVTPTKLAGQIKIPVLLAAGDEDTTAPMYHTKSMQAALQHAGAQVEMKIYEKEGHGNYLMVNQIDWANRVLAFLDKNIGLPASK